MKTRSRCFGLVLATSGILRATLVAHAQEEPVPPAFEAVNPPRPFVPFTIADFRDRQGNPLTPLSIIEFEDGTRRTAAQAIEILNLAEEQVATDGSTLRGGSRAIGQPVAGSALVKQPVEYEMVFDYALLDEAKTYFEDTLRPEELDDVPPPSKSTREGLHELADEEHEERTPGKPSPPQPDPDCSDNLVDRRDTWGFSVGSPNTLYGGLGANVRVAGDHERALFSGEAFVEASLFGIGFSLFEGSGRFVGPADGEGTGIVHVSVLGNTLFSGDTGPSAHQGNYRDSVVKSVKIPIANLLGVVKVDARIGIEGEAGMQFYAGTGTLVARGVITPYAATSGFARVIAGPKIDLGIVKAKLKVGADVTLTFIEDTLAITGYVKGARNDCLDYSWYFKGVNSINALGGRMKLFADAEGCLFKQCVGNRWTWQLFEWPGIGPYKAVIFEGRSE